MRSLKPYRYALPLVLVAFVAWAKEPAPVERSIYLSEHPADTARSVYVTGHIATVLRFEQPVDPTRTKMLGWEGRFEPLLVGGKKVVLEPHQSLSPSDRFLLLVTLMDGTEIPLTVTGWHQSRDGQRAADQQVNVFSDRETSSAVLSSLYASLGRERALREKVERYEQEDSMDHALAALLAKGAVKMTPFRERESWLLKDDGSGAEVQVFAYGSKGRDKAAVVLRVKNNDPAEPWSLLEVRLRTEYGGEPRAFALRASRVSWEGGESGRIAVVMDASAFDTKDGPSRLVLEIFRKDGLRQALVLLDQRILR